MSLIVSDAIFLRRPRLEYISPPVCPEQFSGSSFPTCMADGIPLHPKPEGLLIEYGEECILRWDAYASALKFTVYQADDPGNPEGAYHIFADCIDTNFITIPCSGCYRVSAITLDGESELSDPFCANHTPPTVILDGTDPLSCLMAVFGSVNPGGENATAYFEWGLTTSYGNTTTPQALGNGFFDVPIGEILSGLTIGTTYHYRLVASNPLGTVFSPDATFIAADPPFPTVGATCVARWEADAITAPDLGGVPPNKIITWPDQSGFGRDAAQGLNTLRPYFEENIFGCKPAVRFDEVEVNQLNFTQPSLTTFTAFVAWNLTKCYSSYTFGPLFCRTIPSTDPGFGMLGQVISTSAPVKRLAIFDTGSETHDFNGPSEGILPRGNAVDTWRWDGSICTMRKNGTDQMVSVSSVSGTHGFNTANIGQSQNYIGGYVGAILLFSGALSDEDVLKVENYLNIKYPSY